MVGNKLKLFQKMSECQISLKICIQILDEIQLNKKLSDQEKIEQIKTIGDQIEKVSLEIDNIKLVINILDTPDNN